MACRIPTALALKSTHRVTHHPNPRLFSKLGRIIPLSTTLLVQNLRWLVKRGKLFAPKLLVAVPSQAGLFYLVLTSGCFQAVLIGTFLTRHDLIVYMTFGLTEIFISASGIH